MTIAIDSIELTDFGMIDNFKWCNLIGLTGFTAYNGAIRLANHCFIVIDNLVRAFLKARF